MSIEMSNSMGNIDITNEALAAIAGSAATECYGVVGMASKNYLKDGLTDILGKENFSKGVIVRQSGKVIEVDMYIIVGYGTKISEVAHNVQTKVKYTLDKTLGISIDAINVYVQGVRVTNPV